MAQIEPEFVLDEEEEPLPLEANFLQLRVYVAHLIKQRAQFSDALNEVGEEQREKKRRFLLDLLGVLDAFDRILRDIDVMKLDEIGLNLLEGFRTTRALLEDLLDEEEVVALPELLGQLFDPHLHEVVGVEQQSDVAEGIVLQVREKGYQWQEQLLRRANVIVSTSRKESYHG